jgi:hypothetical protein
MTQTANTQAGITRRRFLAAAGVAGLAAAERAAAQMPTRVAANPLVGASDLHVHAAPDTASRAVDDLELARKAKDMGMRAVVLKNHEFITNDRAYLVRQVVPGIEVFGGIALNYSVGAINPTAVESMVRFTGGYGKVVWLPTHDAAHHTSFFTKKAEAGGIRIIDGSGYFSPGMYELLRVVAKHDLVLATGHISPQEVLAVAKAAREAGVRKLLVTHAMQSPGELILDDMKRCVEMGAVIEHVYLATLMGPHARLEWMREWRNVSLAMYAEAVRALGAEHCIVATDLGQYLNPTPADGFRDFLLGLKALGITDAQLDWMARKNPARLLGLETA